MGGSILFIDSAHPYAHKKYRKNNVRNLNISANMFDPEIQPCKSKEMWVKTYRYGVIISNIMTKNGA